MADDPKSPTPFFSYYRPWIGWVSAIGFTLQFVVFPLANVAFSYFGKVVTIPMIDTTALIAMVTTTVGLGGMRTIEKLKGVHTP